MSDVPFHLTKDGRQACRDFHDVVTVGLPELTRQIHRLNDILALAVEIADRKAKEEPDVRAGKD